MLEVGFVDRGLLCTGKLERPIRRCGTTCVNNRFHRCGSSHLHGIEIGLVSNTGSIVELNPVTFNKLNQV
ncbi:MAG: hypothetical protein ACOX1X_04065 [Dethiobacteria bacterium]